MTVSLMPMECLWPTVSPPTRGNCLPFPEVTVRRSAYQLWQQRTLFLNREEFPIFSRIGRNSLPSHDCLAIGFGHER